MPFGRFLAHGYERGVNYFLRGSCVLRLSFCVEEFLLRCEIIFNYA